MHSTHFNAHSTLLKSGGEVVFGGKFDDQAANSSKTTTNGSNATGRVRRHSAGGRILRYAGNPKQVVGVDSVQETATQDSSAGLDRRRKISLPNHSTVQCPGNARIEIAKREVNLDAYMPVFKGSERAKRKASAPKGVESEREWQLLHFEGNASSASVGECCGGRSTQRKISLPGLKAERSECGDSACRVTPSDLPSTSSIPRVRSGSLIEKKAEAQMWYQRQ